MKISCILSSRHGQLIGPRYNPARIRQIAESVLAGGMQSNDSKGMTMRSILTCVAVAVLSTTLFATAVTAEEKKVPLDKLPKVVSDAVKKMFPKAEFIEAASEEEDGKIEYEVTIKEKGKKIAVTVEADGTIETLEKEIDLKDLPKPVTDVLKKMYPKAVSESAEAVYEIEDGKEELEFYEIVLKGDDGKEIEAKINKDGTVHKDDDEDDKDEKPKDKK